MKGNVVGHDLTVLIIGSGAREHALYTTIAKSPLVHRVLCTPGSGGIPVEDCRNIEAMHFEDIIALCKTEHINLVIVGPEAPLVAGLVDRLMEQGIAAFGPSALAARLEGSKSFMKSRCEKFGIPTARFDFAGSYEVAEQSIRWHESHGIQFRVIKADGLCGGKGVVVCDSLEETLAAARMMLVDKRLGKASATIVMEERLEGKECSVMAICDGVNAVLLPPARDYKRAYDGDRGPNTGGMGAYSPLPDVDDAMLERIMSEIILPTLRGMKEGGPRIRNREDKKVEYIGTPFHGLLYAGIMMTQDGPKLLEYNVRFGDPETQVILPRLKSDIVEYMLASIKPGGLAKLEPLEIRLESAVCVVLASKGYPRQYETSYPITIFENMPADTHVFHAGTIQQGSKLLTSSGRIMSIVSMGADISTARTHAYKAAENVCFENKYYRTDIAKDVV